MIGASKILTVSYGTFSCTLEGFDDPFNTMKAIAEYFRDLAADDRYFGAEPPTPDAAMLHRIAEREIHRRVEAKIEDHGVILRVGEGAVAEAPPPPRAELVAQPVVPPLAQPVAQPFRPVFVAPNPAPAAAQPTADASAISESVAAKLMRIRNVVAQSKPALGLARPPDALSPDGGYAEDQDAPTYSATTGVEGLPASQTGPEILPEALLPEDSPPEATTDAPQNRLTAEDSLPEDFAPEVKAAEALPAIDLGADDLPEGDLPEDDLTEGDLTEGDLTAADLDDTDLDDTTLDDSDLDDLAAMDAAPGAEIQPSDLAPDAALAVPAIDQPEAAAATAASPAAAPDAAIADLLAAEGHDAKPGVAEKVQRARARVVKIRRTEMSQVLITDTTPAQPADPTATAAALSAEAEADLMRELAELEGETGVHGKPADHPAAGKNPASGGNRGHLDDNAHDDAVSRLIAQTNSEMSGPENRRRIDAISHLKAAVVATVAERKSGGTLPSAADRIDPYRSDLSRIVRPTGRTLDAPSGRLAPLVLVFEQRIDRKLAAPTAAPAALPAAEPAKAGVRPRRISAGSNLAMQDALIDGDEDEAEAETNIFTDAKGFAEFADRLGAHDLPALLEAAAAYSACVEGRPHFSRPQLIRQISAIDPKGGFSREDGLRGFGTLLRDGRIVKVKRGQFALTESSQYMVAGKKLVG